MLTQDVVIKQAEPLRIAELVSTATNGGPEHVGPIFARLIPALLAALDQAGVAPGMGVGHYEGIPDGGGLVVHVGFEITQHDAALGSDVTVVDLPVVTVASLTHHGSLDTLPESYQRLAQWVQDNGHTSAGPARELYHRWSDQDPANNETELQVVLAESGDRAQ